MTPWLPTTSKNSAFTVKSRRPASSWRVPKQLSFQIITPSLSYFPLRSEALGRLRKVETS